MGTGPEIYRKLGTLPSLAGTWSNLGTIYSYQGDYKKAIDTYNEATLVIG